MKSNDTLAIILGGGQGSRLFPLTAFRSKPAVPIGGKYRLIDVPISGCLHADIRRIFVLTQFNSASLNRHITGAYRLDRFSGGFVEILAAEQTPDNPHWYQGTADAVRQAVRHFTQHDAEYSSCWPATISTGWITRRWLTRTRRTERTSPSRHSPWTRRRRPRWASSGSTATARSSPSRRSPRPSASARSAAAFRRARRLRRTATSSRSWRRSGIYVFTRRVLVDMLHREAGIDFGRELIPNALGKYKVMSYLYRGLLGGRRDDRVVLRGERDAGQAKRAVQILGSGTADLHAPAPSPDVEDDGLPPERLDRRRRVFAASLPHLGFSGGRSRQRSPPAHASSVRSCWARISTKTASRRATCRGSASGATWCWIA